MWQFLARFARTLGFSSLILLFGLGLGVLGYRYIVGLPWLESLLNAAMILAGEGPVDPTPTAAGKVFASLYALFSGLIFVAITALLVAPILRRTLHRFHLDDLLDESSDSQSRNKGSE